MRRAFAAALGPAADPPITTILFLSANRSSLDRTYYFFSSPRALDRSMVADILSALEPARQVLLHEGLGGQRRGSHEDLNALLVEQGDGTLAHAAGNDHRSASLSKPGGQQAGLVCGGVQILAAFYHPGIRVYIDKGEALTVSEVQAQGSVRYGYGYPHKNLLLYQFFFFGF